MIYNDKYYYLNGDLHRIDGPAVEYADGSKTWYIHNKYHRIDGPAVVYAEGTKEWCFNGKLHRLDGPAIEWSDGSKEWWIYDKHVSNINNFIDDVICWLKYYMEI